MGGGMTTATLIQELRSQGVTLEAVGERLRFHPRSAVPPDLLQRMCDCKAELLAMLHPQDGRSSDAADGGPQYLPVHAGPVMTDGSQRQDLPGGHRHGADPALGDRGDAGQDLQPQDGNEPGGWILPPWPPVVPDSILAAPVPTCSNCGRLRVVGGQPGRPSGLCFRCWGKRNGTRTI